jgi:hypothetical protein
MLKGKVPVLLIFNCFGTGFDFQVPDLVPYTVGGLSFARGTSIARDTFAAILRHFPMI